MAKRMAQRGSTTKCGCLLALITAWSLLCSSASRAGFLEFLSQSAQTASTLRTCGSFDEGKAQLALENVTTPCPVLKDPNLQRVDQWHENVSKITDKFQGSAEDNYFAALAEQHSTELSCAAQFSGMVSSGDAILADDLVLKVQLLREYKQQLIAASNNITSNPAVQNKICPLSLEDLDADYSPQLRSVDSSYQACRNMVAARTSYQTTLSAIPLSNVPSIVTFLDKYAAGIEVKSEADLRSAIQSAYGNAQGSLIQQSQKLDSKARTQGGAAFSRNDRRALLSDPRVNEKVVERAGGSAEVRALSCSEDARYGGGADKLDSALFVGSLAISGGASIAAKASSVAIKIAEGANAARGLGLLSLNASRLLQVSSLAVNGVLAYEKVSQVCTTPAVTTTVYGTKASGACSDAPSIESLGQDSCILTSALSALSVGAPILMEIKIQKLLARLQHAKKLSPTADAQFGPKGMGQSSVDNQIAPHVAGSGDSVNTSTATILRPQRPSTVLPPEMNTMPEALRSRISRANGLTQDWSADKQVDSISDIPWRKYSGTFIPADAIVKLIVRTTTLSRQMQSTITAVYNHLHDTNAFEKYMSQLSADSALEVKASGIASEVDQLEKGVITRNAVLRVLVKRARARGDDAFSTVVSEDSPDPRISQTRKPGTKSGFRAAVGQGPFFDKGFNGTRHGTDMHLLQRDYVSDTVNSATDGKPSDFWTFLGSKQGINYWVPLFDAIDTSNSLGSPEVLRHLVIEYLPLN
jgi:hypothetical protein